MYKDTAGQHMLVYAHDVALDAAKTGDAANITAMLSKDAAAAAATDDVNPAEVDAGDCPGWYAFDMLQAETNADVLLLVATSPTANVRIDAVYVYTRPSLADMVTAIQTNLATAASIVALDAVVDTVKVDTAAILIDTSVTLDGAIALLPTAGDNADAVWDELIAAHVGPGSAGETLTTLVAPPTAAAVADAVWEEPTGAHMVAGSAARALTGILTIGGTIGTQLRTGLAQAGGVKSITLDPGATATNDYYKNCLCSIIAGTGAGQTHLIVSYVGVTRVATLDQNWTTPPNGTSEFVILPLGLASRYPFIMYRGIPIP